MGVFHRKCRLIPFFYYYNVVSGNKHFLFNFQGILALVFCMYMIVDSLGKPNLILIQKVPTMGTCDINIIYVRRETMYIHHF